jgi:hypothetical protein
MKTLRLKNAKSIIEHNGVCCVGFYCTDCPLNISNGDNSTTCLPAKNYSKLSDHEYKKRKKEMAEEYIDSFEKLKYLEKLK